MLLKTVLEDLLNCKVVRVTGSYADGSQNEDSDIDFYVKENSPDSKTRNIEKVIKILAKHGVKWRSTIPGYIFTHNITGNGYLEKQLEFSDCFRPRKNRLKEVEIKGVKFKTY